MEAYLDNSATTPVSQGVKEIVIKTMMEDYGNPSSMQTSSRMDQTRREPSCG